MIALAKDRGLRSSPTPSHGTPSWSAGSAPTSSWIPREDFAAAVREVAPDGVDALFDTALLNGAASGDPGRRRACRVRGWNGAGSGASTSTRCWSAPALERTDWLEHLREIAGDGRIALRALDAFAPTGAAEAHRQMEAGGLRGRLLIAF